MPFIKEINVNLDNYDNIEEFSDSEDEKSKIQR